MGQARQAEPKKQSGSGLRYGCELESDVSRKNGGGAEGSVGVHRRHDRGNVDPAVVRTGGRRHAVVGRDAAVQRTVVVGKRDRIAIENLKDLHGRVEGRFLQGSADDRDGGDVPSDVD